MGFERVTSDVRLGSGFGRRLKAEELDLSSEEGRKERCENGCGGVASEGKGAARGRRDGGEVEFKGGTEVRMRMKMRKAR